MWVVTIMTHVWHPKATNDTHGQAFRPRMLTFINSAIGGTIVKKKPSYHKRLLSSMLDGNWHTFRDLFNANAKYIDKDVAIKEDKRRHPEREEERVRVRRGRKRLVFLSLNSAIHHAKTVIFKGARDWDREYRLTKPTIQKMKKRQLATV
jgi:hypothetical protein